MAFEFQIQKHVPAHLQITQFLRGEILCGRWDTGARLPPIQQMARQFGTNYRTVHIALDPLVQEGLIVRVHGSGNYVRERPVRLTSAALYYTVDSWMHPSFTYYQLVGGVLQKLLVAHQIEPIVLIDSRPDSRQVDTLPALLHALKKREVQGFFVVSARPSAVPALERLPAPSAFLLHNASIPARVAQDVDQMVEVSLRELRRLGCRRVGIITHFHRESDDPGKPAHHNAAFFEMFRRTAAELGLETREEWEMHPHRFYPVSEKLGYDTFQKLWATPERPEGLLVYPDIVARGVAAAVIEAGVRVPHDLKLVFHRNAESEFLSPLDVSWVEASAVSAARSLLDQLTARFRGEEVRPVTLPLRLYPLRHFLAD